MSDMHFREPNQVKWQGSRPGHNGTQVIEGEPIAALNWSTVYLVPAGVTFYMTFASLSHYNIITAFMYLAIWDAGPALWRTIFGLGHPVNTSVLGMSSNFWPPIELAPGYSVQVYQNVNNAVVGSVHGWIE